MNNAVAMRKRKSAGDLNRMTKRLIERQGAPFESRGQRFAFEILEHEKVDAVALSDVVKRADVRMRERGDGPGFAIEPLSKLRVVRNVCWQDLDGNSPIEASVCG